MTENALITNADIVFDDVGGRNGRNFRLTLELETAYGGVNVNFNPMRLPQLLEQLGLERFSELKGTYVQIPKTRYGEEVTGIKSIMANKNEKWFETENHIYFGSEFFKGYDDSEMTALYCYMVSFYNYSDSDFLPIFHERKFTKKEFQDIANEIKQKIIDNEHNKWDWSYPDTFLKYAKEYGFKDIDILEVETIEFKVTTYGEYE